MITARTSSSSVSLRTRSPRNLPLVVRAQLPSRPSAEDAIGKAATALLTAGLAFSMTMVPSGPAVAARLSLQEKRQQEEQALQEQLSRLEYALQQQQTAARAELLGKRQLLENTVEQVDTAIQRKLIEEAANEQAAAKKGDELRAQRIEQEAEQIKVQQQQVQVAVAKAEAQLDREEMLEKAREVEKEQQVEKSTNALMELLGLKEEDLGLTNSK